MVSRVRSMHVLDGSAGTRRARGRWILIRDQRHRSAEQPDESSAGDAAQIQLMKRNG